MSQLSKEIEYLEERAEELEADRDRLAKAYDEEVSSLMERIDELEALENFISEHFPQALDAYAVRNRMKEASGNTT
jgi:DNA repair exonuclease SbcCD ATPase subunit